MADTVRARIAAARDDRERRLLRADAVVAAFPADDVLGLRMGQRVVTITERPHVVDGAVQLGVRVMRGTRDVTPPDLNPIRIVNPPVLVPDDAGDVELMATTRLPDGTRAQVAHRFREDPAEALRRVIADLVR